MHFISIYYCDKNKRNFYFNYILKNKKGCRANNKVDFNYQGGRKCKLLY